MAESIGAIIIVTMLIFFGIIFYTKLQRQGISQTAQTSQALSAIELSQRVAQLPELACSSASVTDSSCIDLHKALAFAQVLNKDPPDPQMRLYYSYLFGYARIELLPVYTSSDATYPFLTIGIPLTPGPTPPAPVLSTPSLLLYENKPPSLTSNTPVRIPFHVQNSLDHENYLGVLIITTYGSPT